MKNELRIEIILAYKIHMEKEEALVEVLRVEEKRGTRRGRVSLTQYLKSQEDQDMTKLLYFTRTRERRREGSFFCVLWNEGEGGFI